jgi:hypothetical protein
LPFKYTAVVGKWEDITPIDLDLEEGEVLAINCVFRLRHLPDISIVARNPRLMFLNKIRTMNPKVCDLQWQSTMYIPTSDIQNEVSCGFD